MAANAESVDATQALLNVNMVNITKLNSDNYITWKNQVHSLLDGYELAGFVDGSSLPPDPLVTVNNQQTANLAYTKWKRQDKLIYSGILGTLSPTAQALVATTKSAAEIWTTMAETYANPSRGHIQQLRHHLQHCKKGDSTIDDYMQHFVQDKLALLGRPLEQDEKVQYILNGLPEDYKPVVDQMENRDVTPTITELHEKLLNKEAKLLSAVTTINNAVPLTANVATTRPRSNNGKPNQRQNHWNSNNSSTYQSQKPDNRTSKGYQGRCQLCGVFGHSAKRCSQLQQQQGPSHGLLPTPFRPGNHVRIWLSCLHIRPLLG